MILLEQIPKTMAFVLVVGVFSLCTCSRRDPTGAQIRRDVGQAVRNSPVIASNACKMLTSGSSVQWHFAGWAYRKDGEFIRGTVTVDGNARDLMGGYVQCEARIVFEYIATDKGWRFEGATWAGSNQPTPEELARSREAIRSNVLAAWRNFTVAFNARDTVRITPYIAWPLKCEKTQTIADNTDLYRVLWGTLGNRCLRILFTLPIQLDSSDLDITLPDNVLVRVIGECGAGTPCGGIGGEIRFNFKVDSNGSVRLVALESVVFGE